MRCERKRVDLGYDIKWSLKESIPGLRSAEYPAHIDVEGQSTWRNSAQIINASGVRTAIHSWSTGTCRERITSRRWRTIFARAIFLDRVADQGAGSSTSGSAD